MQMSVSFGSRASQWLKLPPPPPLAHGVCFAGMFHDPEFAVRSQVVDKRGRLLGEGGRTRNADEAIKR
jgi:hypothetical protein